MFLGGANLLIWNRCLPLCNFPFITGRTRVLDYFETLTFRKDYLTQAATRSPPFLIAMPTCPKKLVGPPRKTATTNQRVKFGHRSTNREGQRPVSESDHKNRNSAANEHAKEDRRKQSCAQKEPSLRTS